MKVLWISILELNPVKSYFHMGKSFQGGWIDSMYAKLKGCKDVELAVICPGPVKELTELNIEGGHFYIFPFKELNGKGEKVKEWMRQINQTFSPDVVHIHGSEFRHGLNWVKSNGYRGVFVSIQGLISEIAKYFTGGLEGCDVKQTFRDIIRADGMKAQQKKFYLRGKDEKELLRGIKYVGGRTSWDYAHTRELSPNSVYFKVGEILRESFRKGEKWSFNGCTPHTVFMSQGEFPYKGLHKVIQALQIVKREYPGVQLRVAGYFPDKRSFILCGGYARFIRELIRETGLEGSIKFLGILSEEEMLKEYMKANLFISASSIENSPNSLGEAMMVGTPVLSSYCGGAPDMLKDYPESLYRFEEETELAWKIIRLFQDKDKIASPVIKKEMYDADENLNQLLEAYRVISERKEE
ncbi:MAG: glycosyltransferase family 4 protein [Muribaculaceae bacterium]|nr:glycosyltransferase family 4 protein [Muribaculaceae bacterium]